MRKALLASSVAGLALAVGFATPAIAEDTDVTITVTAADGLTITVPGPVNLGTGNPGAPVDGPLGAVAVSDQRAALNASWNVTVVTSPFTTGGATVAETIPATSVSYWSGPATVAAVGTGVFTPGQLAAGNAVVINTAQDAFTHTGGSGDNSVTWNPTLVIDIPAGKVAGAYTGTVTHTVV
jgi:hypothetical protein